VCPAVAFGGTKDKRNVGVWIRIGRADLLQHMLDAPPQARARRSRQPIPAVDPKQPF